MKKLIIYIILIMALFACDGLFYEEDNEYIVLDKVEEKIDLINGMYALMLNAHNHEYFSLLCLSDDMNFYSNRNFQAGGIFPTKIDFCDGTYIDINVYIEEALSTLYNNLYTAIINANSIIASPRVENDEYILGETYFLRAYCYFKLARIFGQPPLISNIDVDFFVKKPSYKQVYEFIEHDLLQAIKLLPDMNKERILHETPNAVTAQALLAEVYINMAGYPVNDKLKYNEAVKYAGLVIEQNAYSLLPDMANLWNSKNKYNNENIFSLFFNTEQNRNNHGMYEQEQINYFNPAFMMVSYLMTEEINIMISPAHSPEIKFYINYPDNYRKSVSFITGSYSANSFNIDDDRITGLVFNEVNPLENPCNFVETVTSQKFIDFKNINVPKNNQMFTCAGSTIPLYLLRYAQTLLTYAESKARIGELDANAFEALNQVRRRANKLNPNESSVFDISANVSPEQFIDSVVWERAWEITSEPDGRWFDIIRLDLKDKLKSELRFDQDLPSIVSDKFLRSDGYFYKIPEYDRLINPNLN